MKCLILIVTILISSNAISQTIKDNFERTNPIEKVVEVKSNKLEMGYQDLYKNESNLFAYKVNGVYVKYNNKRWFIPFNRIQSIESKEEIALKIYFKGSIYNLERLND
jgi:hypothetical protein